MRIVLLFASTARAVLLCSILIHDTVSFSLFFFFPLHLDDMGLGKTVQMIALVLANRPQSAASLYRSTLVVAPLSLIDQWEEEITRRCVQCARARAVR